MQETLRIVHHLHRTGGTLISKCIASLSNIALLSEVNPGASFMVLDPVFQASFWLKLLSDSEAKQCEELPFSEKINAIHSLASKRGEKLVLRNWAYLDFFAKPFTPSATNELTTLSAVEEFFSIKQIVTVRHPMDQWLSWCAYKGSAKADDYGFEPFIDACCEFELKTQGMNCIRYEDFVSNPHREMKAICEYLDLEFDPIFLTRWPYYHQITGDDNDRASGDWKIEPKPRRKPDEELLSKANNNPNYQYLLKSYGYEDAPSS